MQKISLKEKYQKEVKKKLAQKFEIKNIMAVPSIQKIVVNMGVGELAKNKESLEKTKTELASITGQKPSLRLANISVAGFNLRRGMPVGLKVTLRGERAYNFFDKLISIILPRLRDFRGVSQKSFDVSGNYTLGITDIAVFPEIDISKLDRTKGMEITIVTNTKNFEKSKELLSLMGMPFEKEGK